MPTVADPLQSLAMFTLADALFLVSFWKPVVLLIPLVAWAWFVSTVFDKHAARFHLPRERWNMVHLILGTLATAAAFLMPLEGVVGFIAGLGAMLVILGADLAIFINLHNRDERVPESHKIRLDLSSFAEQRAAKKASKEAGTVELKIVSKTGKTMPVPEKETPEFEVRVASEHAMTKAIDARARLFEIAPLGGDSGYAITAMVDGVRQGIEKLPAPNAVKMIDFWKESAGLDVQDRRKKQRGTITVSHGDIWHREVLLQTVGGPHGPKLTLTFDPTVAVTRDFDDLGLFPQQVKALEEIREQPGGLILVAAAGGNGLTTTMYALLGKHDPYTSIVQTIEYDIQAPLEGVNQNKFDSTGDAEYATVVRSILRRDPDVVAVTDFRDAETAHEVVRADLKRSKVYMAIRAENAILAIQTLVKYHGNSGEVAEALTGVVAEKLARRLCVNCRVAYKPDATLLKKLGLPADRVKQLYKKGGQVLVKNKPEVCPMCSGVGYLGQIGLFEVFPVGDEAKKAIRDKNWTALQAEFRKTQLFTIQQAGLRRAVEGVTSLEEFTRVTARAKPKPAAQSKSPSKPAQPAKS
ncbi:MAG TPA: hypothetical protein ENJ00_09090 [Phycisphaerales bacterium]|nr:hypothetical protein [Phycisphaerales bacterium]